jgi:hypothetical protein
MVFRAALVLYVHAHQVGPAWGSRQKHIPIGPEGAGETAQGGTPVLMP